MQAIRSDYKLKSRYDRLRARGLLTVDEMATRLAVSTTTIKKWREIGLLSGHVYNDRRCYLYEMPDNPPIKQQGRKRALSA